MVTTMEYIQCRPWSDIRDISGCSNMMNSLKWLKSIFKRAVVQIPGQQANMNQSQDTEVMTLIFFIELCSLFDNDNDNGEHQVWL